MKSNSSNAKAALSIALAVLIALLVLSVQQAYASSCFTDTGGHWAETFICWMKTNGLTSGYLDGSFRPDNNITRAEVASLLYHYASAGDLRIATGTTEWEPNAATSPAYPTYSGDFAKLRPGAVGSFTYDAGLAMVSSTHSQQMILKGVEMCYDATLNGGTLNRVDVYVTAPEGFLGLVAATADPTARNDAACRTYMFSSPFALAAHDSLTILAQVGTSSSSDYIEIWSMSALESYSNGPEVLSPVSKLAPNFPVPPEVTGTGAATPQQKP